GSTSAKFFLPTGEPTNTSAPTVVLDANDAIHTVYPAYVRGGAFYGYCGAACRGPDDVKVVPFETDGTVHNAMIALDSSGMPQVLLQTAQHVYYATCNGDCSDPGAWSTNMILELDGDHEVSGKAFALDLEGHPRFVLHTTKAYLGVGQKTPETFWVSCDSGCDSASSWTQTKIADQMWRASTLRYDADGRVHVAMIANVGRTESSSGKEMGAYAVCEASCERESSWIGTVLTEAFETDFDAVPMPPAISLAPTRSGKPRVVMLGMFVETMKRNLTYFECDDDCTAAGWRGSVLSDLESLGPGLELALDANDKPRFVHTLDYNIALAFCDDADCTTPEAKWDLTKVEYGGEMKPDEIFLYENCTVSAWFLHSPSLTLTKTGQPRVGYQARDISGGLKNPDPATKPDCVAGTDMTWSRLAVMPSVK
ncbi:MAG: hypothetical protein K0S65_5520, partial [Labilithrix sp.]|nr:hypothetical protein [Labilithrix sp.]